MQLSRRYLSTLVCLVAMCAEGPGLRAQQAPPRDSGGAQAAVVRAGTGMIAGTVMSDGPQSQPVRRVTVALTDPGSGAGPRAAVTDDDGRFTFANLPARRYLVTATKAAYLPTAYGVTKPAKPGTVFTGTAIALEEGQRLDNLTLRMTRGGVLSGVVRTADGRPVREASIALMYYQRSPQTGARVPTVVPTATASTDSRGVYRIFGLPPGDYLILAAMPFGMIDLELTTAADVQRVGDLVRASISAGVAPAATTGQASPPRRPVYGYAPAFYPGTPVIAEATTVSLGIGEERGGLDFTMRLVPNSVVTGTTVGPDGRPVAGVSLTAYATVASEELMGQFSSSDAQGRFSVRGLAPGTYGITATLSPGRGLLTGRTEIALAGGDDANVTVTLQPALTMSGQMVFESGAAPPADLSRVRVVLVRDDGGPRGSSSGAVNADGGFNVAALVPGRYRLTVSVPQASSAPGAMWFLKSARVAGRDVLDAGVDLSREDVMNAVLTMTANASEISGAIQDGAGRPAPEYFIVAFPSDRALWTWNSRRIQQTRPTHDGNFAFRNLPAGEYLIGAVTDVEQNEWFEPEFLTQLVGSSVRLTLAEGERKVQNLRLR